MRSLAAQRYYAHPQNQFWRLAGTVIDRDLASLAYEDRLAALLDAGIGLWDMVATAARAGSLDSAIRAPEINDLAALDLPALRAVASNGAASAALAARHWAGRGVPLIRLPSSSPAYTLAFESKRAAWLELRAWLG